MHLVLRDLPPGEQGYYKPIAPLEIVIARQALRPAATTLHEIGHFLDHWALGLPGVFAAGAHRDLDAWIAAVAHSTAISELAALAVRTVSAGVKDLTDHLNYLLRPEELWARSYTQYIATRSGDRRLMAQVADARSRPTDPNVGYIPYQWDDLDFEPVAAAIDDLFRSYGWSN